MRCGREDVLALVVSQYMQARRWAWGVTDLPYVGRTRSRTRRVSFGRAHGGSSIVREHINWAIAPFVIIFGATVPLLINPAFARTTLGQNLPIYAS